MKTINGVNTHGTSLYNGGSVYCISTACCNLGHLNEYEHLKIIMNNHWIYNNKNSIIN